MSTSMKKAFVREHADDGWTVGRTGILNCPCGHNVEDDGQCPNGHVSPMRTMGII